jgi:hypothetical protein
VLSRLRHVSEFPQHDRRSANLYDAIQTEPGEGDRTCRNRCRGEDDHAERIPCERHHFKLTPTSQQEPIGLVAGVLAHPITIRLLALSGVTSTRRSRETDLLVLLLRASRDCARRWRLSQN